MNVTNKNETPTHRFTLTYNELFEFFQKEYDCKSDSFTAAVNKVSTKIRAVDNNRKLLLKFADLRNVILHHDRYPSEIIAEPVLRIVEEFEKIKEQIMNPKKVFDICSKNPRIFEENGSILEALDEMKKKDFSQIIVKVEKRHTLFTGEAFVESLKKNLSDLIDLSQITLGSILREQLNSLHHDYIARNASIYDAHDAYLRRAENANNPRLYALLVSQNGKPTETPIGLVTPWDLIKAIQ